MIGEALTAVLLRLRDEGALSIVLVEPEQPGRARLLAAHGGDGQGPRRVRRPSAALAADPEQLACLIGLAGETRPIRAPSAFNQFSRVLRRLNVEQAGWVDGLSWLMVAAATISQAFVWAAVLTERLELYFVEELGWLLIFTVNTAAAAYLCLTTDVHGGRQALLLASLVFGAGYLPFQVILLRGLRAAATRGGSAQARVSRMA